MIWKDTIFTVISILNFLKSSCSQTFIKTKIILESNTIAFHPYNLFVFVNLWLLVLFKKFNMDIWVKMVSFQIIQNVLNVKTTLVRNDNLKKRTRINIICIHIEVLYAYEVLYTHMKNKLWIFQTISLWNEFRLFEWIIYVL